MSLRLSVTRSLHDHRFKNGDRYARLPQAAALLAIDGIDANGDLQVLHNIHITCARVRLSPSLAPTPPASYRCCARCRALSTGLVKRDLKAELRLAPHAYVIENGRTVLAGPG
jgi:hypothetical protein